MPLANQASAVAQLANRADFLAVPRSEVSCFAFQTLDTDTNNARLKASKGYILTENEAILWGIARTRLQQCKLMRIFWGF